jgi:conjugative relaxase-like TrwC/TraI family protein
MSASIRASSSAAYYLERGQTLYYLTGQLGVGVWHGEGAKALGFSGVVLPEGLQAAYDGFSPDGSRKLIQNQGLKERQCAWDITVSCSKYVSVLWSRLQVTERHRLEAVVMEAAKRTVDYLDTEALYTRRGKYGAVIEKAKGVYALIPHGTSRALDPQLHVHILCANICLRSDGTTGTIRSRDLYLHKMAAGAVFHLELAHLLLHTFGLKTVPDEDNPWTFKIPGVPEELCQEFSKRREAILAVAHKEGWSSPKAMAMIALATRESKQFFDIGDCFEKWQETAEAFGFTSEKATQLLTNRSLLAEFDSQLVEKESERGELLSPERQKLLSEAVAKAIESIAVSDAYFPERRILQEANTFLQGKGFSASQVINAVAAVLQDKQVQQIEIPAEAEYRYFSTQENIAAEKELIDRVTKGKDSTAHLATKESVERAIKKEEQLLSKSIGSRAELTEDQKQAVTHITLTPGDTALIQGTAGTGKTQMLNAAHRAWKESGYEVLGTSITGKAAQGLERATKIPSVTVASLLHQLRPELGPKEMHQTFGQKLKAAIKQEKHAAIQAGQWLRNPAQQAFRQLGLAIKNALSPKKHRQAIKLTEKTILVVDEISMLSTKAWLALKQECDKVGAKMVGVGDRMQLPSVEAGSPFWSLVNIIGNEALTKIVRQRHEWMRNAAEHIIADRPLEALQLYRQHDSLHLAPHKRAAVEKLVDQFSQTTQNDFEKVAAIANTNAEVRSINQAMQQRRKAAKLLSLSSTKLPNGERVHVGDIIALRQNDYEIDVRNGVRGTVIGISRPQGLFRQSTLKIALHGESVGWSVFRGPKVISIDLSKYPRVQLGYAITTFMAQGATFRETHCLVGDSMLSKNMAYTMATRHTDKCQLYATEAQYSEPLEQIAKDISRSVTKDLATDYKLVVEQAEERRATEASLQQRRSHFLELSSEL